jgi:hypothetical protein
MFFSDTIVENVYSHFKKMLPLLQWLKKALSKQSFIDLLPHGM